MATTIMSLATKHSYKLMTYNSYNNISFLLANKKLMEKV